jgi:segregation and condensation protein A
MLLPRPAAIEGDNSEDLIRARSWCAGCRSTSASSVPPPISTASRASSAMCGRRARSCSDKPPVRSLPQVTLQEMLLAFKEVAVRATMFAHHHVTREPLSVRERMSNILAALEQDSFLEFTALFTIEEGRAGVTVSFIAILELMREG